MKMHTDSLYDERKGWARGGGHPPRSERRGAVRCRTKESATWLGSCRLALPCVGYRDNFVAIPQLDLVSVPRHISRGQQGAQKSEAGPEIESPS